MRLIAIILLLVCFYYFVILFKDAYIDYKRAKFSKVKVKGQLMPGFVLAKTSLDKRQKIYFRASYIRDNFYHEAKFFDSIRDLKKKDPDSEIEFWIDPRFPNQGYANRKRAMLKDILFMLLLILLSLVIAGLISFIICSFL